MPQLGKKLITIGIILLVAGLILYFAGGRLTWLGRLPGDIRIERENFKFYFPITTIYVFLLSLEIIFIN